MKRPYSILIYFLTLTFSGVLLLSATQTYAAIQPSDCPYEVGSSFANTLKRVGCMAGYIRGTEFVEPTQTSLVTILGSVINIVLSLIGVIFVILIIYGGWLWGTSRGNEEQVTKAEGLIRSAVIGVIVVFSAFVIANFLMGIVSTSLTNQ